MPAPVINSFTASPNPVIIGSNITFSWNVSNATSGTIQLTSPITAPPIALNALPSGSMFVGTSNITNEGGYTWTLTVTGDGATATTETVTCNNPDLYPAGTNYKTEFVSHLTAENTATYNLTAWNTSTGAAGWNPSGGPVTLSEAGTGTPFSLSNWEGTGYNITASIVNAGANAVGSNFHLALSPIPMSRVGGEPTGTSPNYYIKASQNGHDFYYVYNVSLGQPVDTFGVYVYDFNNVELNEVITVGFAQDGGSNYNPFSYTLTCSGQGDPYIEGPDDQGPVTIVGETGTSYDIKMTSADTYNTTRYVNVYLERNRAYGSDPTHWNVRQLVGTAAVTTKQPPASNAPTYSGFINLTGQPPLTSMYDPTSTYVTFTNFTGSRNLELHCIGDNTNPGGNISSWTTAAVNGWYINESSSVAGVATTIVSGTKARADIKSAPFMDDPTINGLRTFRVTAYSGDASPNNVQTFTVQTYLPDVNPNLSNILKDDVAAQTVIDSDPITIANLSPGATSYASIVYESGTSGNPGGTPVIQRTRNGSTTSGSTIGIQNGDIIVLKAKSHDVNTSTVYRVKFGLKPDFSDCSATVSITYTVSSSPPTQQLTGFSLNNISDANLDTQYRTPISGPMILDGFTGDLAIYVVPQGTSVPGYPPPAASNCYIIQNYSSVGTNFAVMSDNDVGSRTIQIEARSANAFNTSRYFNVVIYPVGGGASVAAKSFWIKTKNPATEPPTVTFTPTSGQPNELVTSNVVNFIGEAGGTLWHLQANDSTTEISVDGGGWQFIGDNTAILLSTTTVTLQLRANASPTFGSVKSVILSAWATSPSSLFTVGTWQITTVGNTDLTIMAEY